MYFQDPDAKYKGASYQYKGISDVPGRTPQRLLGAVLFIPETQRLLYSSQMVPENIINKWHFRQSYMGQLELLAPPWAIQLWGHILQGRSIILFVDNDSAAANLVRGYSPMDDSCTMVGNFWLTASSLKLHVYIDHVESKSNLADGPSRLNFDELKLLGGIWTPSKSDTLDGPTTISPFQSGKLEHRGEQA